MAYRRKGGSALMALAKAGGKRRRAAKKAAETKIGGKKYVTPLRPIRAVKSPLRKMKGGTNLSARAGQVDPTKRTPKQPTRTPKQRASDKKKLLAEQGTARAAGNKKSLTRFIPQMSVKGAEKVGSGLRIGGEVGLALAALAGSGGGAAPALGATRGGKLVLGGLNKAKSGLSKLFKGKPKPKPKPKPSTGTPTKPSGSGSASGGKKPSGSGSRTTNRQSTPKRETPAARNKRKNARAERKERLDSGGTRVKVQKRNATLTRGRKTQAQKRAARQKRKNYNL